MGRITPRRPPGAPGAEQRPEPAAELPAPPEEEPSSPRRMSLGWRVVLIVWVIGFGVVACYELGNFLWQVLRGMF